jgi:hypothetical protein
VVTNPSTSTLGFVVVTQRVMPTGVSTVCVKFTAQSAPLSTVTRLVVSCTHPAFSSGICVPRVPACTLQSRRQTPLRNAECIGWHDCWFNHLSLGNGTAPMAGSS